MTASQTHILCTHPATKAGRAACRKIRANRAADLRTALQDVVNSYFTNVGSCEEIGAELSRLSTACPESESLRAAATGYYEEDLDMEEIICLAQRAVNEIR